MSVFIKGMKMPLDCGECGACIDTDRNSYYCGLDPIARDIPNIFAEKRPEWCPLIEATEQPVKLGHWIKRATEEETPRYKAFKLIWACSECGMEFSPAICQLIRYCPNCGADMRGGKPNE